jgi:hypothetical protein
MHQIDFHYRCTFFDQNTKLHTGMSLRIIYSVAVRFSTLKIVHLPPHRSNFLSVYSLGDQYHLVHATYMQCVFMVA